MEHLKGGARFILTAALGINLYVVCAGFALEDYTLCAVGGLSGALCAYSLFRKR